MGSRLRIAKLALMKTMNQRSFLNPILAKRLRWLTMPTESAHVAEFDARLGAEKPGQSMVHAPFTLRVISTRGLG